MSESWRSQRERGSPALVRLILWLALHFGRRPTRLLLLPIAGYFFATAAVARRASARFLARALGRPPRLTERFRHFHTFSAVILDRVFFLAGRYRQFDIHFEGLEVLDRYRGREGGCLLLGAHLGSFEAMRALAVDRADLPLKVLMYQEHNAFITRLLETLNPEIADTVIPLGRFDTLLNVRNALADGHWVGLLGDRIAESRKVVDCRFFGLPARFPAGPMLLARMLNAPVILFTGLYCGGNRYDIHFELLVDPAERTEEAPGDPAKEWTRRYVDRLEHYARQAPFNWFNFYDYWEEETSS